MLDLVEHGQAESAGQRIAAERGSVMARLDHTFDGRAGEHGAKRKSSAQRLGQRDDVGRDAAVLEGEHHSCSPEAALDLVEDQNRAGAIGDASRRCEVFVRQRDDAALPHHRLENDRVRVPIDGRFKRGDIVRRNERHAGHERLEWSAIGGVSRQRQRAERPSVKALLQRHETAAAGIGQPREFQGRLIRLRAAVAEKRAEHSRGAHEPLAENALGGMKVEVRNMEKRTRLIAQRLHQPRMLMSEGVDSDAAEKVPVLLAVSVDQTRTLSTARMKRRARIGAQQKRLLPLFHRSGRFVMKQQGRLLLWFHSERSEESPVAQLQTGSQRTTVADLSASEQTATLCHR